MAIAFQKVEEPQPALYTLTWQPICRAKSQRGPFRHWRPVGREIDIEMNPHRVR
jgi:hypothetical protein